MGKESIKKPIQKNTPAKQPKQSKSTFENTWYFDVIGLGIVILLGCIIYSNSFDCSFHFDDDENIVKNLAIRNLSDVNSWWNVGTRPIAFFTYAINYHFNKLDVWGYHFVNLMIHLVNACLVYWLTMLIFSTQYFKNNPIVKHKKSIAIITSLLFVSHPLATQSVTYIVQRMASLATLFYFLSLVLYLKGRLNNANRIKYLYFFGAIVTAYLAFHTKENSYTLPFCIILFELYFFQTKKLTVNLKDFRVILFLIGILIFVIILVSKYSSGLFEIIQPDEHNEYRTITHLNYLLTQFSVIPKYIQLLFLPINQNLDYDIALSNRLFEIRTLLGLLFLLSIIAFGIFLYNRNRIVSFGIFWFFLTISIESSIIILNDPLFEHRTYLPSFGFFLIISFVMTMYLWDKYKGFAISIFALIITANSYMTFERNKVWKDDLTLWSDVILKSPNKARPYGSRADLYSEIEQWNKAISDYSISIQVNPRYSIGYNNRGTIYKKQGQLDKAIEDYSKAIELTPNYYKAYNNRGTVYLLKKNYVEAIKDQSKAIEINPDFAMAYANRGVAELNLGENKSACIDFKNALNLGFQPATEMLNKYCK